LSAWTLSSRCVSIYNFYVRLPDIRALQAASGVSSNNDALVDFFKCIGNLLKRLQIYTEVPFSFSMTDRIAKIIAELLSALALATKLVQQGRSGNWIVSFDLW